MEFGIKNHSFYFRILKQKKLIFLTSIHQDLLFIFLMVIAYDAKILWFDDFKNHLASFFLYKYLCIDVLIFDTLLLFES